MLQYFPKAYERYSGNVKVELGLSNYVTKTDLKGATGVDTSNIYILFNSKFFSFPNCDPAHLLSHYYYYHNYYFYCYLLLLLLVSTGFVLLLSLTFIV